MDTRPVSPDELAIIAALGRAPIGVGQALRLHARFDPAVTLLRERGWIDRTYRGTVRADQRIYLIALTADGACMLREFTRDEV
jgi:hypothetical protein